jgi:hypothetical protein
VIVIAVNEQAGDNLRMSLAGFFNRKKYDFSRVGRLKLNTRLNLQTDLDEKLLSTDDYIAIISSVNCSATVSKNTLHERSSASAVGAQCRYIIIHS